MVDTAQNKDLLGKSSSEIYKKLNHLNKLRNRVHLHISTHDTDTDYMKIKEQDFNTLKQVLHAFMMSSFFSLTLEEKKLFNYLK